MTPAIATTIARMACAHHGLSGTRNAKMPATAVPAARKIAKNVVLANSSTSSASVAAAQMTYSGTI